jgi:hypothetical protein
MLRYWLSTTFTFGTSAVCNPSLAKNFFALRGEPSAGTVKRSPAIH